MKLAKFPLPNQVHPFLSDLTLQSLEISNFRIHLNHMEGLIKQRLQVAIPEIGFSRSGVGIKNLHCVVSSQIILMLLSHGPHFENLCLRIFIFQHTFIFKISESSKWFLGLCIWLYEQITCERGQISLFIHAVGKTHLLKVSFAEINSSKKFISIFFEGHIKSNKFLLTYSIYMSFEIFKCLLSLFEIM